MLIIQNLGLDWDERVLPSIGNEIIKAVVAQYNAEQLLTQRDKVSNRCVHTVSIRASCVHCQFLLILWCSGKRVTSAFAIQVREVLTLRAKEFNILVDDVAITHLSFGTEVCMAVHIAVHVQQSLSWLLLTI